MFQAEKNRYEQLLAAIKNEINKLVPLPRAVWIQSTPREIDDPLVLGFLHESLQLAKCVHQLRFGLQTVEKDFDLSIEVEGYTKADIPDLQLGSVDGLYGVMPQTSNDLMPQQTKKALTHREKDLQLKALSQKLADYLDMEKMIDGTILVERIGALNIEGQSQERLHRWLNITIEDLEK